MIIKDYQNHDQYPTIPSDSSDDSLNSSIDESSKPLLPSTSIPNQTVELPSPPSNRSLDSSSDSD